MLKKVQLGPKSVYKKRIDGNMEKISAIRTMIKLMMAKGEWKTEMVLKELREHICLYAKRKT